MSVFNFVDRVRYEGPDSQSDFAFRHYDANRVLLGKTMREHLRLAVCYWHSFCSAGADVFGVSPHLIDVSGSMTKTYAYLNQFVEYFKCKLIVLDPVEDFFPDNLKNISELYLKLRQINATVLLVADHSRNEAFHKVEVGMGISESGLRVHSDYLGCRDIGMTMGAGIWFPTT